MERVFPIILAISLCVTQLFGLVRSGFAQEDSAGLVRLSISFGGGEASTWNGSVSLSEGHLADPVLLGNEADVPGSY
ncbi:MAG: hypothetical protein ACRC2T_18515, partial [Thermoguttaceae bacterium]